MRRSGGPGRRVDRYVDVDDGGDRRESCGDDPSHVRQRELHLSDDRPSGGGRDQRVAEHVFGQVAITGQHGGVSGQAPMLAFKNSSKLTRHPLRTLLSRRLPNANSDIVCCIGLASIFRRHSPRSDDRNGAMSGALSGGRDMSVQTRQLNSARNARTPLWPEPKRGYVCLIAMMSCTSAVSERGLEPPRPCGH